MNLLINIDPKQAKPIYRQIVEEMIGAIKEGYLKAGEKLPSTRDLGRTLSISRFTVMRGYEDLVSAGYVKIVTGSGAYVSETAPGAQAVRGSGQGDRPSDYGPDANTPQLTFDAPSLIAPTIARTPSRFALQACRAAQFEPTALDASNLSQLNYGLPAINLLPLSRWKEVLYGATRDVQIEAAGAHHSSSGRPQLKAALADYLSRARRVRCDSERLMIFTSWQNALDFALRLVVDPGDDCALESPGQPLLYRSILGSGATVHPVGADNAFMSVRALSQIEADIKLICLSPSRNIASGQTMSAGRREEILKEAERRNAYIIENDREHEFRYGQKAVPAIQGMDRGDRVLYLGTVSDLLAPLCRLAYLVLPEHLVGAAQQIKSLLEPDYAPVDQLALANFIEDGHFERHIKRTAEIYAERRAALIHALTTNFGENVRIISAGSGTNILVRFHQSINAGPLIKAAREHNIAMVSAGTFYPVDAQCDNYIFAFGHIAPENIKEGISLFARDVIQERATALRPIFAMASVSQAGL